MDKNKFLNIFEFQNKYENYRININEEDSNLEINYYDPWCEVDHDPDENFLAFKGNYKTMVIELFNNKNHETNMLHDIFKLCNYLNKQEEKQQYYIQIGKFSDKRYLLTNSLKVIEVPAENLNKKFNNTKVLFTLNQVKKILKDNNEPYLDYFKLN